MDPSVKSDSLEARFEAWWRLVPRKVGKGQARRAFRTASRRVPFEALVNGIERYAAECAGREPAFIAHPATWLNGERWSDEPAPAGARAQPGADPPATRIRAVDPALAARLKATEAACTRARAAG